MLVACGPAASSTTATPAAAGEAQSPAPGAPPAAPTIQASNTPAAGPLPQACALLTLADVKQVITDFTVTGPETRPSAFGSNGCWFRAVSDTLKTTVQLQVTYLTAGQAQAQQAAASSSAQTSAIGGITATLDPAGGWVLLRGKDSYAYLGMTASVDSPDPDAMTKVAQAERAWLKALAPVVAGRM
jgi:hypothetical protein